MAGAAGYAYLIDQTPGTVPPATITASAVRFSSASVTAGLLPWEVATGDLNGDGIPDLVVANYGANTISVFLGNGDGTFQNPVSYPVGVEPHGLAIADLNGDGKPDVVVTDWGDKTVDVLMNAGDGTLKPAVSYQVGTEPSQVAIGDFNGDGIPDLAVAVYGTSTVAVLLGNGDGTFRPSTSYATGADAEAIAVGDFNGDGKLDLAVADWGSDSVSVLLGNGDGTFQNKVDYSVGTPSTAFPSSPAHPHAIVAADLNGDGKLDLAVANWGGNSVSVLLGAGDGTFTLAGRYHAGGTPASLAVTDFNGDGIPDLAVADRGDKAVDVLLGKGDGSFMAAESFAVPADPHGLAVADFNGDGAPDLAVACNATGSTTVGLLGGVPSSVPFTAGFTGLADGTWYFHVSAVDVAGIAGPPSQFAVHIDTTPPVTTDNANPGGLPTWHAGPWSLTLSPTDPVARDGSHSGMVGGQATTQYSLDGGATWQAGTSVAFPRWKRGGGSGTYTVLYKSTDAAGNTETPHTVNVMIDNSSPTSSDDAPSAPQSSPVTVHLKGSDTYSEVAFIWYSLDGGTWTQVAYPGGAGVPVTVSGTGTHTLSYYAVDGAGNVQVGYHVCTVAITGTAGAKRVTHRHPTRALRGCSGG